jgi:hypothetical protein
MTLSDRILEHRRAAIAANREVEPFEVTPEELILLLKRAVSQGSLSDLRGKSMRVLGVEIKLKR